MVYLLIGFIGPVHIPIFVYNGNAYSKGQLKETFVTGFTKGEVVKFDPLNLERTDN